MMKMLKALGNLYVAVALLAVLGLVLIVSTSVESAYGTPFAQRLFYQAGWFDVLLALFFVNILAATLTRWPFKKHHTGFVVTHIGILMVLVGSLLTRLFAVDGQLALAEKEAGDSLVLGQHQIVLHRHDSGSGWTRALAPNSIEARRGVPLPDPGLTFHVEEIIEDAIETTVIKEGSPDVQPNRAVKLKLSSARAGLEETVILSQTHPFEMDPSRASLGPATIELKEKKDIELPAVKSPSVHIHRAAGGHMTLDLGRLPKTPIALEGSDLTVRRIEYFPDARVENNKLISLSDAPHNPAVELEIADASGRVEKHTRFALFPDFESMHGRERKDSFGITVELLLPEHAHPRSPRGASMTLYAGKEDLSFESANMAGKKTEGVIEVGKVYEAGWMDFKFSVAERFERAVFEPRVHRAEGGERGELAVKVSVRKGREIVASDWLTARRPFAYGDVQAPVVALLEAKKKKLPFRVTLEDFRKVDYPGTSNAASYESDVTLEDPAEGLTIKKTISMNKPLDHKGYRIFQSSYSQDPSGGEFSIFTVAKNPGISLIYSGSVILFAGVIIIFYVSPLSSFSQLKGKRK